MKKLFFVLGLTYSAWGSALSYTYTGEFEVRRFLTEIQQLDGRHGNWKAAVKNSGACFQQLTNKALRFGLTGYRLTEVTAFTHSIQGEMSWHFEVSGQTQGQKSMLLFAQVCPATNEAPYLGGQQ